jgi:pimeloyl-ACP methyl ester carboxylesterase
MHPSAPRLKRAYADGPAGSAVEGQVHYYDAGGTGRPLLLLHQSPTSAIDFADAFPYFLAAGFRVIAPDMPGLGMSDAPREPPVIADFVSAALAVLDHAGVVRADIVGHHTGAQVAVGLADRAPERVGKLVLYGVPIMSPDALRAFWEMVVPAEKEDGVFRPQSGGGHLSDLFKRLEPLFGLEVANRMVISRLLAGPTLWYAHNAALSHDMTSAFLRIRHPVMLMTYPGEMLDANTHAAAALRPDAVLTILPISKGPAMDVDPEGFVSAVTGFLA